MFWEGRAVFTKHRKDAGRHAWRKAASSQAWNGPTLRLAQESNRSLRFSCKVDRIVNGLPVDVHQTGAFI